MTNNPFTKTTFETIWLKHFANSKTTFGFKSIFPVKFYKDKRFPLYINLGKNITNGVYYELSKCQTDYKGKTFLIYDVPEYFSIKTNLINGLKIKKSNQFKGYACDLMGFNSFEDYFKSAYKKSRNRSKFRRNINRLEACFDVEYKVYVGDIDKAEYDSVFNSMIDSIKKRFDSLGLDNNIVAKRQYYHDLIYKMILKREALLFVLKADGKPIAISYFFLSDQILFAAITTFDIDFLRYNLGHTIIIKMLEWCFDNNIKILDFSKGENEYKKRWCNMHYEFSNHILYDATALKSKITAGLVYRFFNFKQYLRDKKVNFLYNRLKYIYRTKHQLFGDKNLKINELKFNIDVSSLQEINIEQGKYQMLKEPVLSYIYLNPEPYKNLKFYKKQNEAVFYMIGKEICLELS